MAHSTETMRPPSVVERLKLAGAPGLRLRTTGRASGTPAAADCAERIRATGRAAASPLWHEACACLASAVARRAKYEFVLAVADFAAITGETTIDDLLAAFRSYAVAETLSRVVLEEAEQ
ncbi:MAG: hypothetical protein CVU56_24535 [Deltaproteobacteria bacterium HGW-Deltaproteobacteria-14]|jgi:hypothetical protein|nr:MAG: hypothetical protein CVU56_24535 [Deltaproteobacteria bacterium HGW-Deltaproteobacteria-14]